MLWNRGPVKVSSAVASGCLHLRAASGLAGTPRAIPLRRATWQA
ncbi:hypothetical protein Ga0080559_TMP4852 [Salipiger profundus]|uniref:Uncharacterized protein n=1 Tax=Salipiger profundus TaxID=1229727 RepID=A0A1U7DBZ9_9RHOB|nr:hypothetical protein Ga0080559_TMP4852 [Salipiger profundus]